MKLYINLLYIEPGRQKLGRYRSPVSRHSIQSYILTYYRLRKREPLIALGSHQEGNGEFCKLKSTQTEVKQCGGQRGEGHRTMRASTMPVISVNP